MDALAIDDAADAVAQPNPDSGGDSDAPMPSNIPSGGKLVFVTEATVKPGVTLKSVPDGDSICQNEAASAGHSTGSYAAWLSTQFQSAPAHLASVGKNWYLNDGTLVVTAADLVAGTLQHAIDQHAGGAPVSGVVTVWTGTLRTGTTGSNCTNWTLQAGAAVTGDSTKSDFQWTETSQATSCSGVVLRLYCFER
jgi:hypothetical protein